MALPVVESGSIIVGGGAVTFDNTITRDQATLNLTGETVVATIRAEDAPWSVIDSSLEDMGVTVDDPANGGVTLTLNTTQTGLLAPPYSSKGAGVRFYLLQYKVTTQNYFPQLLRFGVRRRLD